MSILGEVSGIIRKRLSEKSPLIVAIDGRCASGKTTLAQKLREEFQCNTISADHFFLQPHQRTKERLSTAGENIDHERFLSEVLVPLKANKDFYYRPFDCSTGGFGEEIHIKSQPLTIIEGSYCCHHKLREYYDIKLFLTISPEEQKKRIVLRDGAEKAEIFKNKWIPLEEEYFTKCDIKNHCDYIFTV
ncbi:MAG: uridine kinase [Ruminococcus sp.]|nr:uridine kinase [Ruminococcus sp.]